VKKWIFLFVTVLLFVFHNELPAQCSICTKSAQQLGDKPAQGLNLSIFFLAFTPLTLIGIIWYKWWKNEKAGTKNSAF
jgi:hypothetical protein